MSDTVSGMWLMTSARMLLFCTGSISVAVTAALASIASRWASSFLIVSSWALSTWICRTTRSWASRAVRCCESSITKAPTATSSITEKSERNTTWLRRAALRSR